MLTVKKKIQLLKSCFGEPKLSSTGENINVKCPVCKEKGKITNKKKLSISIESGIYHCWVCEAKGSNIGKLSIAHSAQQDAAHELFKIYRKKVDNKEEDESIKSAICLPSDFKLITSDLKSKTSRSHRQYLYERGFNNKDIAKFRIGYSNEREYQNRVIFPSFDNRQKLNYFIARSILPNSFRRYKNCKASRKDLIFREFDLDFDEKIILTEGVFDLTRCPDNSTCILGSWLDENYLLFQKIVKNRTPTVLCLDPDAKSKTVKIAKKLYEYCVDVSISFHDNKDFGEMSSDEINYYIKNAKPYNNVEGIGYLIKDMRSGSAY
jgi:hypothetical protein